MILLKLNQSSRYKLIVNPINNKITIKTPEGASMEDNDRIIAVLANIGHELLFDKKITQVYRGRANNLVTGIYMRRNTPNQPKNSGYHFKLPGKLKRTL